MQFFLLVKMKLKTDHDNVLFYFLFSFLYKIKFCSDVHTEGSEAQRKEMI